MASPPPSHHDDEDDELESLPEGEVREWLASTFTRTESNASSRITFKSVAQAVAFGQYIVQ